MTTLGPYELNTIVTGDARELAESIPDNSIDLIFTDPVYDRIEDYEWLARTAARVLKPDRACLAWCGIPYVPDVVQVMRTYLGYRWQFAVFQMDGPTCPSKRFFHKGFNKWHTCVWLEKGNGDPINHIVDFIISKKGDDNTHEWRKGKGSYVHWLDRFTNPGDIVADFFTGGGTVPVVAKMLGVNYWACEIDPETAEKARQRVALTQPPLFIMPQPEQAALFAQAPGSPLWGEAA